MKKVLAKLLKTFTQAAEKSNLETPTALFVGSLLTYLITYFFTNYKIVFQIKKRWKPGDPYNSLFEIFDRSQEKENLTTNNKKKKDPSSKFSSEVESRLTVTLDKLVESRQQLVESYQLAEIERINNQGRKTAEEIIVVKNDTTQLNSRILTKLDSLAKNVYSIDKLPVVKKTGKRRSSANSLFTD